MKAAAFEYVRPADLAGAVKALAGVPGEAKPLGGGQSLGPMLNLRLARPKLLVDVSRLESMRAIEDRGGLWRIGGAVTHSAIEDASLPGGEPLSSVARGIAYRTIRNRGTIGGSLAHADPAADWPLALPALGAEVVIAGPGGERRVAAAVFMQGAFATALAEDELVVAVEVPKLSAGARWGYWKFCRKTGEFPQAIGAVLDDPERGEVRAVIGATLNTPHLVADARALVAKPAEAALLAAADAAGFAEDPYNRRLHAVALRRAIERLAA